MAENAMRAFQQALQVWEEEKKDDSMERDTIQKVNARKESARLIALRQKKLRDEMKRSRCGQRQEWRRHDEGRW